MYNTKLLLMLLLNGLGTYTDLFAYINLLFLISGATLKIRVVFFVLLLI